MHLTTQQQTIIRATVAEIFGMDARVWLFGSRVDASKRGGDIDLLIETSSVDVAAIMRAEIAFQTKLHAEIWQHIRHTRNKFAHDYPDDGEKNTALINVASGAAKEMYLILTDIEKKLKNEQPTFVLGESLPVLVSDTRFC
ncbi:MAG: nucleotidyltransferase domain-containing protein [Gallionella sp.]|nr:nucleotidyltransferase domain-containing protein [Gallionella sp.]MDD4958660.1 nucleotidyltransferase domain-containing protein [Gallionella sp.]